MLPGSYEHLLIQINIVLGLFYSSKLQKNLREMDVSMQFECHRGDINVIKTNLPANVRPWVSRSIISVKKLWVGDINILTQGNTH